MPIINSQLSIVNGSSEVEVDFSSPSIGSKYSFDVPLYAYNSTSSNVIASVNLTDTTALIIFGGNTEVRALVATNVDGTITYGSIYTVKVQSNSNYFSAVKLDEGKVLCSWQLNTNYAHLVVLTVSGTVITVGTSVTAPGSQSAYPAILATSPTKAILFYKAISTSNYGRAAILTITGTTISIGTSYTVESANVSFNKIESFTKNSAVIVYANGSEDNWKKARVIQFNSGTTIAIIGDRSNISNEGNSYLMFKKTDDNFGFLITMNRYFKQLCSVGHQIGGSGGASDTFSGSSSSIAYDFIKTSKNKLVVIFKDGYNSSRGSIIQIDYSNIFFSLSPITSYDNVNTSSNYSANVVKIGQNKLIIFFKDTANSQYLSSVVVTGTLV